MHLKNVLPLMLYLLLFVIFVGCDNIPTKIYQMPLAAVQNQNETYYSYLPYQSECIYNNNNMLPGRKIVTQLEGATFYQKIAYEDQVIFWTPVKNGFSAIIILLDQVPEYDGYILFDSKIHQFNRQIILYTINQANLTFYYAIPNITISNMSINFKIINIIPIIFTPQAYNIFNQCLNQGSITQSSFSYIGQNVFMFACGALANGFLFSPGSNNFTKIIDFSQIVGPANQYMISVNPYILSQPTDWGRQYWNCALLSTNTTSQQLYFLIYNFNSSNIDILALKQMQSQASQLINRIWGLQVKKQVTRWMDIFSSFNISSSNVNFPGDVVSVFVSDHENIFVESIDSQNMSYLCVFDNEGLLYWNVSYTGSILYYSSKGVFIYDYIQDVIQLLQLDRPIYVVDVNSLQNTTTDHFTNFTVNITCASVIQALNYTLLWTTPNYPTALINFKNNSHAQSNDVIYGFELDQKFEIIGPDFQVIINAPPTINVIVIDSSTIVLNQQAVGIVNIQVYSGNFMTIVFVTNNSVYSVNTRKQVQTLAIQPCGFGTIKQVIKQNNGGYLVINSKNQQCSCSADFIKCDLVTMNSAYSSIDYSNFKYNSPHMQYLNSVDSSLEEAGNTLIKRNLFGLIKQGMMVTIMQNNSALLIDLRSGVVLDQIVMNCTNPNTLNGDIYIREFYDPFLLLFCEQSSSLFQFIIRNQIMYFQRIIPLYGFKTRTGQFTFFPAFSYVFISVDPIVNIFPIPPNCCVLRLDPCQYTVSVIVQIVEARSIIVVTNYRNIDIAIFKSSSSQNSQCVIKAYFPNIWVTFNQTNHTQIVSPPEKIPIMFSSMNYNFGASFDLFIVFNLTDLNLNLVSNNNNQPNLNINFQKITNENGNILQGAADYSLKDYVCGPMFQSFFYRQAHNMTNLQIIQTDFITKTKLLGSIGTQFIQIINPSKFDVSNLTLNSLILAVAINKMYVYSKQMFLNGSQNAIQMYPIYNFTLPEKRCSYYLYQVINQTATTFISNCQGINYNYQSPLLTISYNPLTIQFTYQFSYIKVVPLALRQIYTIVRDGGLPTLVLGILQGPMNAVTGKLFLCGGTSCSPLYISTTDSFLLNYATKVSDNLYIVMSIDYKTIQIFINPEVQANQTPIQSNYTIFYNNYINEVYCGVIKMINITTSGSYSIISCSSYYYYVYINFAFESITTIQKFQRYSQCDLSDEFKPVVISSNGQVSLIFAQCRTNDFTFRLSTYQTINSSYPIIYTGYLQIFTLDGPLGPNCTNTISPSKIIPLSTSMGYPLMMSYQIYGQCQSPIYKFLYSEINGILIDNLISLKLQIMVKYQPFTLQYTYPKIQFFAINQFHHLSQEITTNQQQIYPITYTNYIVFGFFALSNLITLVCLICFLCQQNVKGLSNRIRMPTRDSTAIGGQLYIEEGDTIKPIQNARPRETTVIRKNETKDQTSKRFSQIQMFFVKKK